MSICCHATRVTSAVGRAGLAEERTAKGGRIPAVELTTGRAAGPACPACKAAEVELREACGKAGLGDAVTAVGNWKLLCYVNIEEFGLVIRICSLTFAIKL